MHTLQQRWTHVGVGLSRPESAHAIFEEDAVAAEQLISSFTGQHGLDAVLLNRARQQPQRHRGGAHQRRFAMKDHLWQVVAHVVLGTLQDVMIGAERAADLVLGVRFVVADVGEADAKGRQLACLTRRHGCQ